jgi:two-component system response regulator NreC
MVKLILADDHTVVRSGIKMVLEGNPDIEIIGEAVSGLGVMDLLKNGVQPDMILTDLNMPHMSGMDLLKQVTTAYPEIRMIILTMVNDEITVSSAFENGAGGYLLKHVGIDELIFAINHVSCGGKYLSTDLAHYFFKKSVQMLNEPKERATEVAFTSRELEILELLSDGYTNVEMGEKLFLSVRTIEGHRQSLIDKTKSKNTAVLIKYAVIHGLVS